MVAIGALLVIGQIEIATVETVFLGIVPQRVTISMGSCILHITFTYNSYQWHDISQQHQNRHRFPEDLALVFPIWHIRRSCKIYSSPGISKSHSIGDHVIQFNPSRNVWQGSQKPNHTRLNGITNLNSVAMQVESIFTSAWFSRTLLLPLQVCSRRAIPYIPFCS